MPSSKFASDCLEAHNDKRKKHGVSKLKLNSELCVLAESWAHTLLRAGELKHSSNTYKGNSLGENIAAKSSNATHIEYTGKEVVEQWYAEHKDYDHKAPGSTGLKTGHFSQIVWKDSQEFGVGVASGNGRCIVVAHYYPPGNVIGQHKENVFPVGTSKSGGSKLKNLLGGKKERRDSSSDSSSDEDEARAGKNKKDQAAAGPTSSHSSTTKVTITRTTKKADGTVEVTTEERVTDNVDELTRRFHQAPTITSSSTDRKPKSSAVTAAQSTSEFRQDALNTHNKLRALHKVGKLKLNSELCSVAQKWADHLASITTMQHSNNSYKSEPLGENIASKWGSTGADYTGAEAVEQWYSEESLYDYTGKSNSGKSGHFTQVVWKGSLELGIAKAKDAKGRVYVVANYHPAGNFIGRYAENVFKPK